MLAGEPRGAVDLIWSRSEFPDQMRIQLPASSDLIFALVILSGVLIPSEPRAQQLNRDQPLTSSRFEDRSYGGAAYCFSPCHDNFPPLMPVS